MSVTNNLLKKANQINKNLTYCFILLFLLLVVNHILGEEV